MSRCPRPLVLIAAALLSLCAVAASAAYLDPPGRVARLSHSQGDISYSPAGEDGWYGIHRNRPLVRGDRLWTASNSRAEFQVGSAAVRLDQRTALEILELNDRLVQLELSQGTINLRIRRLYPGQEFEVATPGLAFVIDRPGNYRIDVDARYDETTVVVWRGRGTAYGEGDRFQVRAGDAVRFYGIDLRDYELFGLPQRDDFDRYCSNRDSRLERSLALRYLGDDVIGYSDLDGYGNWRPVSGYGNAWFPSQVGANWAPYRDGHWVWQDPWGWTWVDDAPWGFAPSHYGRWIYVGDRWGWIPGPRQYRPIYAPALVVFIGSQGWSLSISMGGDVSIGWFPLGPRDIYLPPYQASRDYFSQVNVSNTVINNITINNVYNNYSSGAIKIGQRNYAHRDSAGALTAVPASVFVNSRPIRQGMVKLDRNALRDGELTRVAPIAPRLRSVRGTEATPKPRPAIEPSKRPVVVRSAPPARERPFAEREKQLQQTPGRALATRPEPRAQENVERNIRVIRDKSGAVDTRATGPRGAAATPAPTATPRALDRAERKRPARPVEEKRDEPAAVTPPATRPAEAEAAAARQAAAAAREQARAEAQARTEAQAATQAAARADEQQRAAVRAQAEEKARADAQARTEAQAAARAEAQQRDAARAQAQEKARADAQVRAEAQAAARADAQARAAAQEKARADAQAQAAAQAAARADERQRAAAAQAAATPAQTRRDAQRAAELAARNPPGCLTAREIEALKRRAARGEVMPEYVACEAVGD